MNLNKEIFDIAINDIMPNRFQPREIFDDNALEELSSSIREHGVIQPIIVRKVGDKFEIIAGERRYRASKLAGKTTIPAIVKDMDDKEAAKIALLENLQRKDLSPIEEAKTYQTILKLDNLTQEELATSLGKSQSNIANKLRLLQLDDEVQTALLNGRISERHARSLLNIKDPVKQKELLNQIIVSRMTVKQLDDEVARINNNSTTPVTNQTEGKEGEAMNNQTDNANMDLETLVNQTLNIKPEATPQTPKPDSTIENVPPVIPTPATDQPAIINAEPTQAPAFTIESTQTQVPSVEPIPTPTTSVEPMFSQTPSVAKETPTFDLPKLEDKPVPEEQTQISASPEVKPSINIFDQLRVESTAPEPSAPVTPAETTTPAPKAEESLASLLASYTLDSLSTTNEPSNSDIKVDEKEPFKPEITPTVPVADIKETAPMYNPTKTVPLENTQITVDETMNKPTIPITNAPTSPDMNNIYDLRFAINNVRQAVQNTEKFGFKIKVEELDLSDMYQIVIRINKE